MADLRKAAQMAIEALEKSWNPMVRSAERESSAKDAITALKAALEQQAEPPPEWPLIKNILAVFGLDAISFVAKWQAAQQAEPVAYLCENGVGHRYFRWKKPSDIYKPISLYTAPPQRPWQGLTDEEIFHAGPRIGTSDSNVNPYQILINARAIEAKLKELNT